MGECIQNVLFSCRRYCIAKSIKAQKSVVYMYVHHRLPICPALAMAVYDVALKV